MSHFEEIDAIPAHLPDEPDNAVLMARIIAFNAISHARRHAQALDVAYLDDLARLEVLVSVGMIDESYAKAAIEDVKAMFWAALNASEKRTAGGRSMIDHDRHRARELVEALHAVSEHAANDDPGSELAELLQDAAVMLDSYQAGLILATPHPATGYALVTHEQRGQILDTENQSQQEAA